MPLTAYQSDDVTAISSLAISSFSSGSDSGTTTVHLWNETAQPIANVFVTMETEDPGNAGSYLQSGIAPQDQLWGRIKISGYDNTGDATYSIGSTDFYSMGAFTGIPLGTIPAGCAVYLQVKWRPPSYATSATYRFKLTPYQDEYSIAIPASIGPVGTGIVTGFNDYSHSGIIEGLVMTATGTPDDQVHVTAGRWLLDGEPYAITSTSITLNQTDGDTSSLTSGESYYAAITAGTSESALTTTKGSKSSGTPTKPALPTGELLVRYVLVEYDAGGGQIETADIDTTSGTLYDRFYAEDGGGVNLTVYPGKAVGYGSYRFRSDKTTVALTDDSDNWIWLLADGTFSAATTYDPPSGGILLWYVLTASGSISTITDRRRYVGQEVTVEMLDVALSTGTGEKYEKLSYYDQLYVDKVVVQLSGAGSGSSGSGIIDIEYNGASIFPDAAERPTFAFDAAGAALTVETSISSAVFHPGVATDLAVHVDQEVTGGDYSGVTADVYLLCRRTG